jgi:MauM/NapG family ferredoxin protein
MRALMSKNLLRPPGALPETRFLATCIRCGKCAQTCPYGSIRMASLLDGLSVMGTPVIQARKTPCYLCMKCPTVCPSGALKRDLKEKEKVRMGTAEISRKTCLAWQDTLCRSCYDDCPLMGEAITMNNDLRPEVNTKKCVGCGICENICPLEAAAIVVKPGSAA